MIIKVFALRDVKADAYGSPFFVPSEGIARRLLGEWTQDPRSEVAKYSADFTLYELGTFNNETGLLEAINPVLICSAMSCKPRPDPKQPEMFSEAAKEA